MGGPCTTLPGSPVPAPRGPVLAGEVLGNLSHRLRQRHGRHGEAGAGQRHPHPGPAGGERAAPVHAVQDSGGGPAGGPQGGQPGPSPESPPWEPVESLLTAGGFRLLLGTSCVCEDGRLSQGLSLQVLPAGPSYSYSKCSQEPNQTFPPFRAGPGDFPSPAPQRNGHGHRPGPSLALSGCATL